MLNVIENLFDFTSLFYKISSQKNLLPTSKRKIKNITMAIYKILS